MVGNVRVCVTSVTVTGKSPRIGKGSTPFPTYCKCENCNCCLSTDGIDIRLLGCNQTWDPLPRLVPSKSHPYAKLQLPSSAHWLLCCPTHANFSKPALVPNDLVHGNRTRGVNTALLHPGQHTNTDPQQTRNRSLTSIHLKQH